MPILYLCPSGISVLEHCRRSGTVGDTRSCLEDFVRGQSEEELMRSSAEVNTLFRMGLSEEDRVIFFCSDTDEGKVTADVLAKTLKKRIGCEAVVKPIHGLQTSDSRRFDREGIPNLTDAIITEYENNRFIFQIILIATTGFKATIPYVTLIGIIFGLPIRYIFESSKNIIDLPPVPLEFDLERLQRLEPAIGKLMENYLDVPTYRELTGSSYDDVQRDAQDILLLEDDHVVLRPVGRILYQRYLRTKGYKIYLSPGVNKKLESGRYDRVVFEDLFRKMKDPIHVKSKLHPEVKQRGKVDLECYKAGRTSERIFFHSEGKSVYICNIFMHDEYERELDKGGLLWSLYKNEQSNFTEFKE